MYFGALTLARWMIFWHYCRIQYRHSGFGALDQPNYTKLKENNKFQKKDANLKF